MKRRANAVYLLLLGLAMSGRGVAASGTAQERSQFQRIAERNPFRLRPTLIAAVKPLSFPVVAQPLVVEVTGLTDVTRIPRVLAEIHLPDQRILKPVLSIGDQIEGLEVIAIDVRNGTMTARVRGNESRVKLRPSG